MQIIVIPQPLYQTLLKLNERKAGQVILVISPNALVHRCPTRNSMIFLSVTLLSVSHGVMSVTFNHNFQNYPYPFHYFPLLAKFNDNEAMLFFLFSFRFLQFLAFKINLSFYIFILFFGHVNGVLRKIVKKK